MSVDLNTTVIRGFNLWDYCPSRCTKFDQVLFGILEVKKGDRLEHLVNYCEYCPESAMTVWTITNTVLFQSSNSSCVFRILNVQSDSGTFQFLTVWPSHFQIWPDLADSVLGHVEGIGVGSVLDQVAMITLRLSLRSHFRVFRWKVETEEIRQFAWTRWWLRRKRNFKGRRDLGQWIMPNWESIQIGKAAHRELTEAVIDSIIQDNWKTNFHISWIVAPKTVKIYHHGNYQIKESISHQTCQRVANFSNVYWLVASCQSSLSAPCNWRTWKLGFHLVGIH